MALRSRSLAAVAVTVVAAFFPAALCAQESWAGLGGSGSGAGVSNSPLADSDSCSIGIGPSGSPVVAWQETVDGYEVIYVRRWNPATSAWEELAGSASGRGISPARGRSTFPVLKLDANGHPVVAWVEDAYFILAGIPEICLKRWNGSAWEELGGSATLRAVGLVAVGGVSANDGVSLRPSLDLDASGHPTVAWQDGTASVISNEIYLRRWTGSSWEALGGSASRTAVTSAGYGIGGISESIAESDTPSVALDAAGFPVVAWRESPTLAAGQVRLKRWNGTAWTELASSAGAGGISGGTYRALAPNVELTRLGEPVVAWLAQQQLSSSPLEICMVKWNGTAWTGYGGDVMTGMVVAPPEELASRYLVLDGLDNPGVAWEDPGSEIYFRRWTGAGWVEQGGSATGGGISASSGDSKRCTLALDARGLPAVAWVDGSTGNPEICVRLHPGEPAPPELPQVLAQFRLDGLTPKPPGEQWIETGFVASARLFDLNFSDRLSLQVEVRPFAEPFTGTPTATSPLGSNGGTVFLAVTGLPDGTAYHWQARAVDNTAPVPKASPWVSFGVEPESLPDFIVRPPNRAPLTSSAGQGPWEGDRTDFLPGASYLNLGGVRLQVFVSDPEEDDAVLEVELRPVGQPFSDIVTSVAAVAEDGMAVMRQDLPDGSYHWQYRPVDVLGKAGPWVSFGENPEEEADFSLIAHGSSGLGSCLNSGSGAAGLAAMAVALLLLMMRPAVARGLLGGNLGREE